MFHRRLYFVIPDESQAVQVVTDLNAGGVDRRHIHAIAGKGILLTKLPPANTRQLHDAAWRIERAGWTGNLSLFVLALAGLVVSIALGVPAGAVLSIAFMALTFVAGALFALRVPDTHLDEFRGALSHGEVLLLVDVPHSRVAEVEEVMRQRHPEAVPGGASWTIGALGI